MRSPDGRLATAGHLPTVGHALAPAELPPLGPLDLLVQDPLVSDLAVNADGSVWADRGEGMRRCPVRFDGPHEVRLLADRLAALAGRRLDEVNPWVDGLLPHGIRLHAVIPPVVAGGAHVTLRLPTREPMTLTQLQERGSLDAATAALLMRMLAARVPFLVTGGTGSGKTTLLAALLGRLDPRLRIVIVEDVPELRVPLPQVVRLHTRQANVEGVGDIPMTALVRQALRMRPDRLVVGEVRGPEVRELLLALNTGHEGGCGTLHANSAVEAVTRLEALGALAGMSPDAVRAQAAGALRAVVHLTRAGPRRFVREIAVLPESWLGGPLRALSAVRFESGMPAAASRAGEVPAGWRLGPGWERLCGVLESGESGAP